MAEPKKKKQLDLVRREMPKQLPEIRSHNFSEVALGYAVDTAVEEASRCIQCPKPKCVENCPVEINIPGFIKAIAERDFKRGIQVLKDKNCLPAICGRV
jgi:glutamate synthase (NADPH/NADH) small chain